MSHSLQDTATSLFTTKVKHGFMSFEVRNARSVEMLSLSRTDHIQISGLNYLCLLCPIKRKRQLQFSI